LGILSFFERCLRQPVNAEQLPKKALFILPDHLHCIFTLPAGEADFSTRWQDIKVRFAEQIPEVERLSTRRQKKGERGI
jgi:putative transposase